MLPRPRWLGMSRVTDTGGTSSDRRICRFRLSSLDSTLFRGGRTHQRKNVRPTARQDAEAWDEAIGLNFTAARRLAESALPAMRRARWGRIITITGSLALKRMNAATPAKAAIASWSRALSIQVAADGITVNCVAPGRINSEQVLNRLFPTEEIRRREIELNVPAGRFGEPDEIAAVITFLASARASYVTGTMIPVDGGFLRLDLK